MPIDTNAQTATAYVLVPPGDFKTDLVPDSRVSWTHLEGIGQYGWKGYMADGYIPYKVPGVWKYRKSKIQKLQDSLVEARKLDRWIDRHFVRLTTIPEDPEIVYAYTGLGETLITKATVYALVPKKYWRLPEGIKTIEDLPRRGLRYFHDRSWPDGPVWIVRIPGITECTWLEPYSSGQEILRAFEASLVRI